MLVREPGGLPASRDRKESGEAVWGSAPWRFTCRAKQGSVPKVLAPKREFVPISTVVLAASDMNRFVFCGGQGSLAIFCSKHICKLLFKGLLWGAKRRDINKPLALFSCNLKCSSREQTVRLRRICTSPASSSQLFDVQDTLGRLSISLFKSVFPRSRKPYPQHVTRLQHPAFSRL
jgi:hypothetical protein